MTSRIVVIPTRRAHSNHAEVARSIGHVIEAALRASFLLSAPVEPEDRDTVLLWHQKIVDAIATGDAEGASEAMVYVIHNGMRRHEGTVIETAPANPLPSADTGE